MKGRDRGRQTGRRGRREEEVREAAQQRGTERGRDYKERQKKSVDEKRQEQDGQCEENRFLDKEHEWKEEKNNARRERKECESEIINLHYSNQPKCHGIDRCAWE